MGGSAFGLDLQVAKAVGERGIEPLLEQAAKDPNDEPVEGLLAPDEGVAAASLEHVNVDCPDAERRAGPGEHARAIHALEGRHGIETSSTRLARVRTATYRGSSRNASRSVAASTIHQISWPPARHDATVVRRRSELVWPLNDA
jgi:hypothetical protein